jgi:hypothetical protein
VNHVQAESDTQGETGGFLKELSGSFLSMPPGEAEGKKIPDCLSLPAREASFRDRLQRDEGGIKKRRQ